MTLSLGGNLGDPAAAITAALRILDAHPQIALEAVSSFYRTPPWGKTDQPDFVNAAAMLSTTLEPGAFLEACLAAERQLKRVRAERWGPRLIDIDVLTFGERHVDEPGLTIPHPRMTARAFVMVPLAEIAPDLEVGGHRIADWAAKADRLGIEKL